MFEHNRILTLLVDDNPSEVELVRAMLDDSALRFDLQYAPSGQAALARLRQQGDWNAAPLPALILLDLNMPEMHGLEVLKAVKQDAELRFIPVVVFTTSDHGEDIRASYHEYANCYVTKPGDSSEYRNVLQTIEHFWARTAKLPSSSFA